MIRKKQTLTEAHEVPANGRPTEVKVGYRTIKIKYVGDKYGLIARRMGHADASLIR